MSKNRFVIVAVGVFLFCFFIAWATAQVESYSTSLTVSEEDVAVSTEIGDLDFGAGFDITESPTGEANISLDASEIEGVLLQDGTTPLLANWNAGGFTIEFDKVLASQHNLLSVKVATAEKWQINREGDRSDIEVYAVNGTLNIMRFMDTAPALFGRPTTYGRAIFQTDLVVYNTQGSEAVYGNDPTGAYMFEGRIGDEASIYAPNNEGRFSFFSTAAAYGETGAGVIRVSLNTENGYHLDLGSGSNDTPGFARTAIRIRNGSAGADNLAQGARGVDFYEFIEFQNSIGSIVAPQIRSDDNSGIQIGGNEPVGIGRTPYGASALTIGRTWTGANGAAQLLITGGTMTGTADGSYSVISVGSTIAEAAGGVHPLLAGIRVVAPSITNNGATTTEATTVHIAGAPTIGVSNYALHVAAGAIQLEGPTGWANDPILLGNGVATFAATSNVMTITGDGGANAVTTVTGGIDGQKLTLIFIDALVTMINDDGHGANTLDLNGNLVSADDTTLEMIFDGTSWYETSRSVN